MPVRELYVEGSLDNRLLRSVIAESGQDILVTVQGTKDGLRPKVLEARKTRPNQVFLLRDRDFDYDVEMGQSIPQHILHPEQQDDIIGWHWCRHEIENYLLEPAILHAFLSPISKSTITIQQIETAIQQAAISIRHYQAARWTIGTSKRRAVLPPPHDLKTRPCKEFKLPQDLGRDASVDWIVTSAADFLKRVQSSLGDSEIRARYDQFDQTFSEEKCSDVHWVLHHFSGKDLFCAMKSFFQSQSITARTERIIEGVSTLLTDNPQLALQHLPEWQALLTQFKSLQ